METFTIKDNKLGFKLDKTKQTPTISNISTGGSLEKGLIETCSTISVNSEIIKINEEFIVGLNYEEAMGKFKSYTERPIKITIKTPEKVISIRKISMQEMEKISKETTEKSLRDLVKSEIDKKENSYSLYDISSSDEDDLITELSGLFNII